MSEADILATTYTDVCSIHRPCSKKLATGETVQRKGMDGQLVADSVPCALSKHGGGRLKQSASVATANSEPILFTRPEVDVQAGDLLLVVHLGKTEAYTAGKPERQPSHNNVPLTPVSGVV